MITHEYSFRVKYPDTDRMGTVHHSNYAKYYETARWELFRSLGISYRSVEDAGYLFPVIQMNFRFLKTLHYDDKVTVKTTLEFIRGARMNFSYKLYNEEGILVNEAVTEMACVHMNNWKPCIIPDFIMEKIMMYDLHETLHA
jgi:acyl-CoA thioester hydrolase